MQLASGDAVELDCTAESSGNFTVTQDGIRIHRPGNYMVVYTVHVPANETVSSRFILTLNGDRVAASATDVAALADGSTSSYTMHASLFVPADSLLKLVSLSPVSICQSPTSNVFTLTLHRMG